MKKLSLELDALTVDSFETGAALPRHGTVRGHRDPQPTPPVQVDCTCLASCLCPTHAFYCATVRQTAISCDYTFNDSCVYGTFSAGDPAVSVNVCIDTDAC